MKKKTPIEKIGEYLDKIDITTVTLYRKDRELLEQLRLKYIAHKSKVVGVTEFLSRVINFYKEKGGR